MQLPAIPLIILDTETTGFIPKVNRVIEFASVRFENGEIIDTYDQLFSIPNSIPAQVQTLTHIQDANLEGKPSFEEKREEVLQHIGSDTLIIGQNVGFDIRMLKGEGIDLSDRPWIDTSMIASLVFPELASYSLGYISTILNLNHEPVHRALGDVHATMELLARCWERFLELPPDLRSPLDSIMQRAPEGYRKLFAALPTITATKTPSWISIPKPQEHLHGESQPFIPLHMPDKGTVQLVEESLTPGFLSQIVQGALEKNTPHLIAVKNLRTTLQSTFIPKGIRVLHPPVSILDTSAITLFSQQEIYTADEATLALKLAWYEPSLRSETPVHGEERAIWNGKLACTFTSTEYLAQFKETAAVSIIDHQQLLAALADPTHPAHTLLNDNSHIIIDDASMLEDTATKAYGWFCSLNDLRASAEGNDSLTKFTDILQIWIEKTRQFHDVHYLTSADLKTPDSRGIREQLEEILKGETIPSVSPIYAQLEDLQHILEAPQLSEHICWIEQRQNGSQYIQSVPERLAPLLKQYLYDCYATTLLIPPQSVKTLTEILPTNVSTAVVPCTSPDTALSIAFSSEENVATIIGDPPPGKTVILMGSRGRIADAFVRFSAKMEDAGHTLICQNLSGGIGRMQAEFIAAKETVIWAITPWSFENVNLPLESIDHLVIESLPFDHPAHTILSKRAEHYADPFREYSLARLRHRLYRLLRTFMRYRSVQGDVLFLDKRLENKPYGKEIWKYLRTFTQSKEVSSLQVKQSKRKKQPKKESNQQLPLF